MPLNATALQLNVTELAVLPVAVIAPTGAGVPALVITLPVTMNIGPSPAIVHAATLTVYEENGCSPVIL